MHAAMIAAVLVNLHLRKGARPKRISDFMLFQETTPQRRQGRVAWEQGLKAAIFAAAAGSKRKLGTS